MRKDWVSYIGDYKFYIKLWLAFYLYSLTVGLLVQFVILPIIFPSAHWKDGLMVGGDWVQFHTEGVEIARRVQQEGWSVWTLRHPISGQAMSGIAGLFYALTGIHKPWVLLPFNAFLHASAGLILYILLRLLDISKKTALIFTIPFIIFPTSLTWVSQIHKDGLYILGMYLTFLSLALAFSNEIKKNAISILAGVVSAFVFFTVGREYVLKIVYYFYAIFLLISLLTATISLVWKGKESFLRNGKTALIFFVIFVTYGLLQPQTLPQTQKQTQATAQEQEQTHTQTQATAQEQEQTHTQTQATAQEQEQTHTQTQATAQEQEQTHTQTQAQARWYWNPYIPDKIENLFYTLAVWRNEIWAMHLSGRPGAIDEDIKFRSVGDFIEYTPRALTVGFFSPFPRFWFSKGSTTGGTIARYITPFEAIYLWFAWLLLPIALWFHRKKLWFWLVFLMCLGFVWFHVVAEPNVGPIVRKRYGYVMLLSAINYSTAVELWRRRKGEE
jgi:ABC-type multidrug transport system fused ATPase/permease subunit